MLYPNQFTAPARDGGIQETTRVTNVIANIIGALASITFVGFFAYEVDQTPLTIIVLLSVGLMVYSFYDDARNDRANTRMRSKNGP